MADPMTMAAAGAGGQVAGSIVGAIGSIFGGQSQSQMYKYQAGVAKMNEDIAKQNAAWERQFGEVEAQQVGMAGRFKIGETKTIQSGSGLDVNRGSAVAVRESEQELTAYNEAQIRSSAARKAYGYQTEAAQFEAQANIDMLSAKNARTAGYIGAVSSILGGASSAASKYGQARQQFG